MKYAAKRFVDFETLLYHDAQSGNDCIKDCMGINKNVETAQ